MAVTAFEEIKYAVKVSGVCKDCGKKRTRTVKDYQTL